MVLEVVGLDTVIYALDETMLQVRLNYWGVPSIYHPFKNTQQVSSWGAVAVRGKV